MSDILARDHSMFEAELSGSVLNMRLLSRLLQWLRPYRLSLIASTLLVLIASYATVLMEILISMIIHAMVKPRTRDLGVSGTQNIWKT